MLFLTSYPFPRHRCLRQLRPAQYNCLLLTSRTVFHALIECYVPCLTHARLCTVLVLRINCRNIRSIVVFCGLMIGFSKEALQLHQVAEIFEKKPAVPIRVASTSSQRTMTRFPNTNIGIMRRKRWSHTKRRIIASEFRHCQKVLVVWTLKSIVNSGSRKLL